MLKLVDSSETYGRRIDAIYQQLRKDLHVLTIQQLEERVRRISCLAMKILNEK